MNKLELVAHFSLEIIKQQLASGVKHPSPPLIKEAVEIAKALVEQLDGVGADDIEKRLGDVLGKRLDDLAAELKKRAAAAVTSLEGLDAMIPPKPAPVAPPAIAPAAVVAPPAIAPAAVVAPVTVVDPPK